MKIAFITKQLLNIINTSLIDLWYALFVAESVNSYLAPANNWSSIHSFVDLYVIFIVAKIKRLKIKISSNVRIIPTFSPLKVQYGFAKLK